MKRLLSRILAIAIVIGLIGVVSNCFVAPNVYNTPARFLMVGSIFCEFILGCLAVLIIAFYTVRKLWRIQ